MILDNFELYMANYHCGYAMFHNVFTHFGLNVTETDVYFLSNGFSYEYISDGTCYFGYHSMKNEIEHIKLNVTDKVDFYSEFNEDLLLNSILKGLTSKSLSVLFVNSSCLDYHNIKVIRNPNHIVAVYGVDLERNLAYIGDGFIVDDKGQLSVYKGTMDLDKLIKNTIEFAVFHNIEKKTISRREVFHCVNYNISKFYDCNNNDGIYRGKASLIKYLEDLEHLVLFNRPLFNQLYENISATIKWIRFGPTLNYFTTLFSENEELRIKDDTQILEELHEINLDWEKISFNIIKIGVSGNNEKIHKVIDKGKLLIDKQEAVLVKLCNHIKEITY